jgi:hypothetical protein
MILHYRRTVCPIAGIASAFQATWKDDYIAGMWRSSLVRELDWQVARSAFHSVARHSLPSASATYLAPTWSWVSVNCPIVKSLSFLDCDDEWKIDAELVDCTVIPADPISPLGQLWHGMSVLRAAVLDAETMPWPNLQVGKSIPITYNLDYKYIVTKRILSRSLLLQLGSWKKSSVGRTYGLVLTSTGDEKYIRIGIFQHANAGDLASKWERSVRKVISII